jgi:hypothetical protein
MHTVIDPPTQAAARTADYARAAMHTAAVIADPSASLTDRLLAAEAEEAACVAARAADLTAELEAGA